MNHRDIADGAYCRPARRRGWRRWVLGILTSVFVLLGARLGYVYYKRMRSEQELQEARAEIDRADPGWRLDELEAKRAVVADAKNGARPVLAAKKLLPEKWMDDDLDQELSDMEPPVQLDAEQTKALRGRLANVEAALVEARRLAQYSTGRYAIQYTPDWIGTLVPHMDAIREVGRLLSRDAYARLQDNDLAGALISNRATFVAGRSLGDELFIITTLVRIALQEVAIRDLERTLAQGELPADLLKDFQEAVAGRSGPTAPADRLPRRTCGD
jgi:hypothetical protein